MTISEALPDDWAAATLAGRVALAEGPTPILVRKGRLFDMSRIAPTMAQLLELWPTAVTGRDLGPLVDFDFGAAPLLAPVDLQCIKAAGVTFAVSAIERVIEERAKGDPSAAAALRGDLGARIGGDIARVVPGSFEAAELKALFLAEGLWSQYLEVAIGPDAEIFTKAPVLAAVGHGAAIGVRSDSEWNNPEPEIVLACSSRGDIVGAALGNDVNLRDFEGRSALLLGKAKDNNASCVIGPFLRLFDEGFSLGDIKTAEIRLRVDGADGFTLEGTSAMREISRSPERLVRQAMSEHQYPDGFALFLGTLFAPTDDRDAPGEGFTHKEGDRVRISSPRLGCLDNRVTTSAAAPPWRFGIAALMQNLAARGLIG